MEYDIEKILTMYEDDYNPSSMVPGPRNMNQGGRIGFKKGKGFSYMSAAERSKKFGNFGTRPKYEKKTLDAIAEFKKNWKKDRLPRLVEIQYQPGLNYKSVKKHLKEGVDYTVTDPKVQNFGMKRPTHIAEKASRYELNPKQIEDLKKKKDKFNKKYGLKNKGIKLAVEKTQAGGTTLRLQTNPAVWGDHFKKLGISLRKSAAPNIDGFNELENIIKDIKKTDIFKTYDKSKVMKEGGIKSGKKQLANIGSKQVEIMKYLVDNPNADVAKIAKDLKLDSKLVKADLKDLYGNIYKRVGDQGATFLKDYDLKQLNGARDAIKTININEGLNLKDKIKHLVTDAYQGDKAALKPLLEKIDDFYTLQTKIKGTPYGKFFAGNLDHIVPLNFLRKVEAGENPLNLIRVRPIPEFLNQRAWKSQFDRVLGTAWRNRLQPGGKEALETIINLQSYLPKEFGGITSTGNIIDYGARPFSLKTNLSQADFPEIYKRVFEFIKNPELQETFKQSKVSFKTLAQQEKNIMGQMEGFNNLLKQLCPKGQASGGRIGYAAGTPTVACGRNQLQKLLFQGGGTTAERNLVQRIISGGGRMAIGMLNPKELLRLKNLVGPGALGLMAAYEAGSITDDVLRLNKPLDEALAGNWLTKSFLPYSEEFAKQKNLLQSGQLTGNQREYALEMMKMEEFIKEGKRIEALEANKLVEGTLDDNFTFTSDEDMNKAYQGLFGRLTRMQPYMFEEGITGRSLENEAAMNEYEDAQTARTGASKIFGGPQRMVNKAQRPANVGRGGRGAAGKMKLDYHIPGYTAYDKAYTPSDEEILQIYRSQGIVPATFGGQLPPGEGTRIRMGLAMNDGNRSIFGSKFSEGGITGLRSKYEYKK